jgi:thymidylate kinase
VIVCITGNDASGKATQSRILAQKLSATLFSFPNYDSVTGQAILGNLRGDWVATQPDTIGGEVVADDYLNALVLQSLMNANRIERTEALRAAARVGHVVCDRYDVDMLVYGTVEGLDPTWLQMLMDNLPAKPDLYVLLDVPVEEGFKRRPERRDRYEQDRTRMDAVSAAYVKLFREREKWGNWRIVDGVGSADEVAERVRAAVGL